MSTDDHPVRTIFIETVASRLKMTVEDARKFVAPITTEAMDHLLAD